MHRPLVVAHRGDSLHHPENTLPAIASALRLGADVIELDVQRSADGVAIIMHDRDLRRTTGRAGPIDALDAAEIATLDAGAWRGAEHAGVPVPTLADAVAAIGTDGAELCLEFKDGAYRAPEAAAHWLVAQFARYGLHRRAVANLPGAAVAAQVRRLDPNIRIVLDCARRAADAPEAAAIAADLAATGADVVQYAQGAVTPEIVRACRRRGLPVWAWTANDPADWTRLRAAGVDAILTDDPGGLIRYLAAAAPKL